MHSDLLLCVTPVCNLYVEIGSGPIANNNFRVKKRGWMVIAARNGFNVEDEIDCWALHEAGAGKLSLLIQKVRLIKLTNYYLTINLIFFFSSKSQAFFYKTLIIKN